MPKTSPPVWDEPAQAAAAQAKLRSLLDAGVSTIVDLTVLGTGRNIARLQRFVGDVPIHVIVATGLYTYDELPHYFQSRPIEVMVDLFVQDITQGIQGTGVKAAILKCATDQPGVTRGVAKVLRAIARTHLTTGVPISTHTHPATKRGLEQQTIFKDEGVDLTRVVIGHSGDTEDIDYLEQLMQAGSFIGMDRFGVDMYLATEKRVAVIAKLSEKGYAGQMVLSHDASCYFDWVPAETIANLAPNWHFRHISDDVLPALRHAGVSDQQIDQMMVGNPRRVFEHSGAY